MIAYIRQRITEETLELANQKYGHDAAIMEKAHRLLKEPKLFAVSSTQALEGFVRDDMDLLEASRFPAFKNDLLALLTAQQSTMVGQKTEEIETYVKEHLPLWYQAEVDMLEQQYTTYQENYSLAEAYFSEAQMNLEKEFREVDRGIETMDIGTMLEECHRAIKKEFVRQLCTLNGTVPTDADIKHVLQLGVVKANELLENCCQQLEEEIRTFCQSAEQRVFQRRNQWCPEAKDSFFQGVSLPGLETTMLYPATVSLPDYDIMPYLDARVSAAIRDFRLELKSTVNLWRRSLLTMIREDAEKIKPTVLQMIEDQKRAVDLARATLPGQHQAHRQIVYPEL